MDTYSYWQRQEPGKPLFPDVEWTKPERRAQAGKLGIVGGNKLSFVAVADSYSEALATGVGEVRVLLPDILRKTIPASMTDAIFGETNPSGSLARSAGTELGSIGDWADGVLLIGDAGRSSETAIVYENFVRDYTGSLTITRDAVDLLKNSTQLIVERPGTLLVVSFAQIQKIFQAVYYPKILTFSMQLAGIVESLHKFTITYPVSIVVFHQEHLIVASGGDVVTQAWDDTMAIWNGSVAAKAASYWLWSPKTPLQSVVASIDS